MSDGDSDSPINMDIAFLADEVRKGKSQPRELKLLPCQVNHFNRIADGIIPHQMGYLDGSKPGRGKTITTAAVALSYGMKLFVICPNTVKTVWENIVDAYGLDHIDIINYDRLAGKRCGNGMETTETLMSHKYLVRIDTPSNKEKVSFIPSEHLINLIETTEEGILFVFDECQSIKNHSTARFKACKAIANLVISSMGKSRFASLSASPFDKEENAISFYRLFGILKSTKLFMKKKTTHQVFLLGIQEVIDYAETLDKTAMKNLQYTYSTELLYENINSDVAKNFILRIYDQIVKNSIGSSISAMDEENTHGKLYIYDGYFNVPIEDRQQLRYDIKTLHGLADPIINGEIQSSMNHLAKMTVARKSIEMDKAHLFAVLAAEKLNELPTNRVVICMNFIKSINEVCSLLKDYNPMLLVGKTVNRSEVINNFQRPDNVHRLVIIHPKVGGQGVSMQDLYGGRTTYVFISPDFSIINIFQASGRVFRAGLMSDAYVYLVYGVHEGCYETDIINALIKKNKIVKISIPGSKEEESTPVLFPGEYPEFREIDDEKKE